MSAEGDQLPATWLAAQLGDVINYGKAEKAQPSAIEPDTWVLELEDVEKDTSRVLQRLTFASRQSKSTKNKFEQGDVLYGKLRPYLNKVVHADAAGVCTTEIVPLRPNQAIFGRYLFYWLRHPAFLNYVTEVSHGLDMPRLGTEAGKVAPIVLAPYAEQQRIADKLDTVLARVDACRERLATVGPLLKRFRQAVLAAAMSGKLTEDIRTRCGDDLRRVDLSPDAGARLRRGVEQYVNAINEFAQSWPSPKGWVKASVARLLVSGVLSDVKDGNHGANHPLSSEFTSTGLPFITAAQVGDGGIDYTNAPKVSGEPLRRLKVGFAEAGDVVLTHKGSVGRVAMSLQACVLSPQTTYYRADNIRLLRQYLMWMLRSPAFAGQLDMVKSQTTRDFVPITEQYSLMVLVPPVVEQVEIARRAELLFAFADRLEARLAQAQAATDRLTPALLAKAFRGELVPQDPADEPVAALLKRLAGSKSSKSSRARNASKPKNQASSIL